MRIPKTIKNYATRHSFGKKSQVTFLQFNPQHNNSYKENFYVTTLHQIPSESHNYQAQLKAYYNDKTSAKQKNTKLQYNNKHITKEQIAETINDIVHENNHFVSGVHRTKKRFDGKTKNTILIQCKPLNAFASTVKAIIKYNT